jgi:hypothetical protein
LYRNKSELVHYDKWFSIYDIEKGTFTRYFETSTLTFKFEVGKVKFIDENRLMFFGGDVINVLDFPSKKPIRTYSIPGVTSVFPMKGGLV